MFSFSFTLILFGAIFAHGQTINFNTFEKASLFGQFQNLVDNPNQDQLSCFRVRPNIKNAHPTDDSKYFICRDENRYEIFTCPNGGIFNNTEKACIDLCEQKQPCLNQGQCIILSNLTLQCVCRRDWTGERCEIPLSTCATNPCGPKGECRMLKASDYTQDYVCICDNQQTYGRNCQQTVPNPCLTNSQQFHPFAFSRRAYINCDDEIIFFQPCNSLLYWNQEYKRCDRSLPTLLRAPFLYLRQREQGQPPTSSLDARTQQWPNQMTNVQTNQNFVTQFRDQDQPLSMNTFMETTTPIPRIFRLEGFASRNPAEQQLQWTNNADNRFQPSDDFRTQSRSNQLMPPSFEPTTVGNTGVFVGTLRGWQQNV